MVAKAKTKPAAKASAKPKSGKLSAADGMKMREEVDEETMENKVKDAGLKAMGYKKGGMVKGGMGKGKCPECGKANCSCKGKGKAKGYACGGKVKK